MLPLDSLRITHQGNATSIATRPPRRALPAMPLTPSSRLAARLDGLSQLLEIALEIALARCEASPEVMNQAEATLANEPLAQRLVEGLANEPLAQRLVEGVLLSIDLAPHLLAPLQLKDSAAAAVCSLWADVWKATKLVPNCMDEYRDALSLELLSARLQAERTNSQASAYNLNTLGTRSELEFQGTYAEVEPLYREALEGLRETLGCQHPDTLVAQINLGVLLQAKGTLQGTYAAESLYSESLSLGALRTLGLYHPHTLCTINNLGLLLQMKGDLAAAAPLCCGAMDWQRLTLGSRHPKTLSSINNLGALLRAKGDLAAAEPLLREALEGHRETLGNRHPSTLNSIDNLGLLLQAKGDLRYRVTSDIAAKHLRYRLYDAAKQLHLEALATQRETLGNQHSDTLCSMSYLGLLLHKQGDFAAAVPLLLEAREGLDKPLRSWRPTLPSLLTLINSLALLLQQQEKWYYLAAIRDCTAGDQLDQLEVPRLVITLSRRTPRRTSSPGAGSHKVLEPSDELVRCRSKFTRNGLMPAPRW